VRYSIACLALGLLLGPATANAQSAVDSAAIRATALDYIEGWFTGDATRMEAALHPQLAKRIVRAMPAAEDQLIETAATELVEQTRRGGGTDVAADRRRMDVQILDIFGNAASVRIDAGLWIDYLHLARWNGEWKIVNVLWELRRDAG